MVIIYTVILVLLFLYVFIINSADDMGLGKTLTMIALILSQKKKDAKDTRLDGWLSKTGKLSCTASLEMTCPVAMFCNMPCYVYVLKIAYAFG